jgi:hypothetical protein
MISLIISTTTTTTSTTTVDTERLNCRGVFREDMDVWKDVHCGV